MIHYLVFNRKHHSDIVKMGSIQLLPISAYSIDEAKEEVGAAVRICKAMNMQKYADDFSEIVKGYFTPDEEPDPNDSVMLMYS
jgi:hypothetical protein